MWASAQAIRLLPVPLGPVMITFCRFPIQSPCASYRNWFSQLAALGNEKGVLILQAPTTFAARHLRTRHHTQVLAAVVATHPAVRDVKFEGPPKM